MDVTVVTAACIIPARSGEVVGNGDAKEAYLQMKESSGIRSGERGAVSANPFPWKLSLH